MSALDLTVASAVLPAPWFEFVRRETDVGRVVAGAMRFCGEQGLSDLLAAHVATAVSELANNLWMHADAGGSISLGVVHRPGAKGVEVVAEDQGPGIADTVLALRDGYSTAGSLGCGLPGVQRLMEEFVITSRPGVGTRVVARKWQRWPI